MGQNVDSYYWEDEATKQMVTFANLLEMAALVSPDLRIRFSTSHPKDITDDVLITMAKYENICKCIHLPVQSGSTRLLQLMNRTYSREWYLSKVDRIREILPDCGITSDMIAGFCTETEEDHQDTLSLMDYCGFDMSYMYFYSERPGTLAARRFKDDIPLEVKKRRLQEIVDKQFSSVRDDGLGYGIDAAHHSDRRTLVHKKIFKNSQRFKKVQSAYTGVYQYYVNNSLPWDNGSRIIPSHRVVS